MKRSNLRIIGIEEGEENQLKVTENIFNKIMGENFPNIKKGIPMKVQKVYRTTKTLNPHHIIKKKRPSNI